MPTSFSPLSTALRRPLRSQGIDVLHTHNFAPLIYGSVTSRLCEIGTVNTRHGRAALKTHPLIWALTDRVAAVSEDARTELLKHNRIRTEKDPCSPIRSVGPEWVSAVAKWPPDDSILDAWSMSTSGSTQKSGPLPPEWPVAEE